MSDLSAYYKRLSAAIESGGPLWQACVVETDGSTPARVGMKLAVPLSGDTIGNLGGGEMEYLVINTIRTEQPKSVVKWNFNLDEQGLPSIQKDTFEDINSNSESFLHKQESSETLSGNNSMSFLRKQESSELQSTTDIQTNMLCGGNVEVLIEPLFAAHPLYIIGAGHCGRALAEFAVKADFQVTVIDNRRDLLQSDAFPSECKLIYNDYDHLADAISFNNNAFIVIMTYGHVHDREVLEYCLKQSFRYLGMIGSKKKVAETLDKVKAKGFSDKDLSRIHAPIGLPIGSHTPYEIAVSILSQLIQIKNS
ncbi:MAG: XdhC/CoxI family protein [Candidatus Cloacimonadaceae bacterium]